MFPRHLNEQERDCDRGNTTTIKLKEAGCAPQTGIAVIVHCISEAGFLLEDFLDA